MTTPEVRVVREWHEALNAGDADRLLELSDPDVEIGGPRGIGRGARLLGEWVERANIRLRPRRYFQKAEILVVEEDAEWRDAESGEVTGSGTVASVFAVRDARIARVVRYPDVATALPAAGLDDTHETSTEG